MYKAKEEYAAVDLFKMFCAILVIAIHAKPFENSFWLDNMVGMITRVAVPFFFAVSGFFLFDKIKRYPSEKFKIQCKYMTRLFRFYLIWFVIIRLVGVVFDGNIKGIGYYVKQFFFTTDGSALWFVNGLLWAVLIVSLLTLFLNIKTVFIISIVFLLL